MTKSLDVALHRVSAFKNGSLKKQIATLEKRLQRADKRTCESLCAKSDIDSSLLLAALMIKREAAQIDEVVHAVGILTSLPRILNRGETVEYLSLAAGNAGRPFDLETNQRVAEFKFIDWQGGAESIRQNQLFKDFFALAEYETAKQRFLYVVGLKHPLRFFNGGRALESVLSKNAATSLKFRTLYGERFTRVNQYYEFRKARVQIMGLAEIVPELVYVRATDETSGVLETESE